MDDTLRLSLLEFVDNSEQYDDSRELLSAFQGVVRGYGFDNILVTKLPAVDERPEDQVIAVSWPAEWQARYIAENYGYIDPVGRLSYRAQNPFTWSDAINAAEGQAESRIFHESAEFGLTDGLTFPSCNSGFGKSVVSLSSEFTVDLPGADVGLLFLASSYLIMSLDDAGADDAAVLTPRERDVLAWAAAGKTAWETSRILSISESTIIRHLANIRAKLDVMNTTHAIAKALKTKQIFL